MMEKKRLLKTAGLSVIATGLLAASALAEVQVTAYQNGLGLISESRGLSFKKGLNRIGLGGLGRGYIADSLSVDLNSPAAGVQAINLPDPMPMREMLWRFLGKDILWADRNPASGETVTRKGRLLSLDGGPVLRFGDKVEFNPPGRPILSASQMASLGPRVPELMMQATANGKTDAEVRYLTDGLGWRTGYVAVLSEDETRLKLAGEIVLSNRTGRGYRDAQLRVVAGEVNRQSPGRHKGAPQMMMRAAAPAMEADMAPVAEQTHDFWSFKLPGRIDLADGNTIKLPLFNPADIPVSKRYVLESREYGHWYQGPVEDRLRPGLRLTFRNDEKTGLGQALPAGTMRIYGARDDVLLGESRFAALARGERTELEFGKAFDISARREQTEFNKRSGLTHSYDSSYRITLTNAKSAGVVVDVVENLNGDWKITSETARHVKKNATSAVWSIAVPANGSAVLEYSIFVKN